MKTLLIILGILVLSVSCTPVQIAPARKAENFNQKQAKAIIDSQKKARNKQVKSAMKNRKKEVNEIRTASRK